MHQLLETISKYYFEGCHSSGNGSWLTEKNFNNTEWLVSVVKSNIAIKFRTLYNTEI